MGLERIAAVLQGVHSNYDIDLFQILIKAIADKLMVTDLKHVSLRVIADHLRSCSFLIADGVLPNNEGRGYVLRRIIRRAVRHGNKLGAKTSFFASLVPVLVAEMGDAYPDLKRNQAIIEKAMLAEEEQFACTLNNGMAILDEALAALDTTVIPGQLIFHLYDTYGFPVDLINDIARERDYSLDIEGYETAMAEQRKRSQESGSFKLDYNSVVVLDGKTIFVGYETKQSSGSVLAILKDGEKVESLSRNDSAVLVLDITPFYGESGGQVGDCGYFKNTVFRADVTDTTKAQNHHLHHVTVTEGQVRVGDTVNAVVDTDIRQRIQLNHSATHLMHAALRKVLGEYVTQKGSLVNSQRLRFDFSHEKAVTSDQLVTITEMVNAQIRANAPVTVQNMVLDEAIAAGAMALFGEKYDDEVRVLSMGTDRFSVELCGGTHVDRTGDIGLFFLVSESGVASGVRRIEAVTGEVALRHVQRAFQTIHDVASMLNTAPENVADKITGLRNETQELEKDIARLKQKWAVSSCDDLINHAVDVDGIKVLSASLEDADMAILRDTVDQCKNKLCTVVVLLAAVSDEKISLVAGVSKNITDRIRAGDVIKEFSGRLGGKGGGRPDMAQGGGSDISALPAALADFQNWVASQLG